MLEKCVRCYKEKNIKLIRCYSLIRMVLFYGIWVQKWCPAQMYHIWKVLCISYEPCWTVTYVVTKLPVQKLKSFVTEAILNLIWNQFTH